MMGGLAKRGYEGYNGLDILLSTPFPRAVHIVRQFKPHSETNQYAQYPAYHRYIGLSIAPEKTREPRRIRDIPGSITNLISRVWGLCGYVV